MRIEIARLRAQLDWNQDDLLTEVIKNIQQCSIKLTSDSLTLACERLDEDHLLQLWSKRADIMGSAFQRKYLKDLKRKHRSKVIKAIMRRYFSGEETPKTTKFMIELIECWCKYIDQDKMFDFLRHLEMQNKWNFIDKLREPSFQFFIDYIRDELFDELYKDSPEMCCNYFDHKPTWMIKDAEWQKKWFEAKFETTSQYTIPTPQLVVEHFEWYVELLKSGKVTPKNGQHYNLGYYLMERPVRVRRPWAYTGAYCHTEKLYKRVERLIELLDADVEVNFTYSELVNSKFTKRLRQNPELNLRLWRAFSSRLRRGAIELYGCARLSTSDSPWKREKVILRHFDSRNMVELLDEAPSEAFAEMRALFAELGGKTESSLRLLDAYRNSDQPLLQFLRGIGRPLTGALANDVQSLCEDVCKIVSIRDPRSRDEFPCFWLTGTNGPNIFKSYDELFEDIHECVDLAGFYDLVSAEEFDEHAGVDEILRAVQENCEQENDLAVVKRINKISTCADYLRRFKNDYELKAAIIFIDELSRAIHPESIFTTYNHYWSYTEAPPDKPYPSRQPSPEETLQLMDSLFVFDPEVFAERVNQIKWLPFESPETWVFNKLILTQFEAPRGMSKEDKARCYLERFVGVGMYIDRQVSRGPTLIYTLAYVFGKYMIPVLLDMPRKDEDNDAEIRFCRIELQRLSKRACMPHLEALNRFLLFARLWQNKISFGVAPNPQLSDDCECKHLQNLTGLEKTRILEPWCAPSYYTRSEDLFLPYTILCLKYPTLVQSEGRGWQNPAKSILKMNSNIRGIVDSLTTLLKQHGCSEVAKISGVVQEDSSNFQSLSHRKHVPGRQCQACLKTFLVKTQNFEVPKCLELMCRAGLSKPLLLEAMQCEKLDHCKLVENIRKHGKLAQMPRNHLEYVNYKRLNGEDRRILAEHADYERGNIIRYGLPLPSRPWKCYSDLELYMLLEIFCVSRMSSSTLSEVKIVTPAMRQLGNVLRPEQYYTLESKIIFLSAHLPCILSHQDNLRKTLEQLCSKYLNDSGRSALGLRALRMLCNRLPDKQIRKILNEANDVEVRAKKMKIECLSCLENDLLTELCLNEPTEANIKRLKAVDDTTRVLLGGQYSNALAHPEVQTCLKRLNGIDYNSKMNGSVGNGRGLARLLKTSGDYWNLSAIARNSRVKFACQLLPMKNTFTIGAAFRCLELLRVEGSRECKFSRHNQLIHDHIRPDLTYLSRLRLYEPFTDFKIISDYINYMKKHNFSQTSIDIWLIGVADSNKLGEGPCSELALSREAGIGVLAFGREYSRMSERTISLMPEFAFWEEYY